MSIKNACNALVFLCALPNGITCLAQTTDASAARIFQSAQLIAVGRAVELNGSIYTAAYQPATGIELWRSDRTLEGTTIVTIVKDINPGAAFSMPGELVVLDDRVLFRANDGLHGDELWSSDGTEAGTVMVEDIVAGSGSSVPMSLTSAPATKLVYFTAYSAGSGRELWTYDGVTGRARQLRDIWPGDASSYPSYFAVRDNRLFFQATEPKYGSELWQSDGTSAGTRIFVDLAAGPSSASPYYVSVVGNVLYFRTSDPVFGPRLYASSGTPASTAVVPNNIPGQASLSWQAPATNTDDSALTNVGGYRIYYWTETNPLVRSIPVNEPSQISFEFTRLPPDNYYFTVTVFNTEGVESERSAVGNKRVF